MNMKIYYEILWLQVGSKSEANGIAKSGAKMVMAVSCAKVDFLSDVYISHTGLCSFCYKLRLTFL